MVFPKYMKGEIPCKYCKIGNHTQCKKREYCSCNCPNTFIPINRHNQYSKRTCCSRGHPYTQENIRHYVTTNGKQTRACHQCQIMRRELQREKIRIYSRNRYHLLKEENKALKQKYGVRFREKVKTEVLSYYGNGRLQCVCCGEKQYHFLTLDHINNDGVKERKIVRRTGHSMYIYLRRSKYPIGYQTLCFNCNSGKQINKGICPHKTLNKINIHENWRMVN